MPSSILRDANCSSEIAVSAAQGYVDSVTIWLSVQYRDCASVLRNGETMSVCNEVAARISVLIRLVAETRATTSAVVSYSIIPGAVFGSCALSEFAVTSSTASSVVMQGNATGSPSASFTFSTTVRSDYQLAADAIVSQQVRTAVFCPSDRCSSPALVLQ